MKFHNVIPHPEILVYMINQKFSDRIGVGYIIITHCPLLKLNTILYI